MCLFSLTCAVNLSSPLILSSTFYLLHSGLTLYSATYMAPIKVREKIWGWEVSEGSLADKILFESSLSNSDLHG